MEHNCQKEYIFEEMEKRMDKLDEKATSFYNLATLVNRIDTIVELLVKQSEKQEERICKQQETLIQISETMKNQNKTLEQMDEKLEITNKRIDNIVKSNSFNILDFVKSKVIPFLLGGGILFYVMQNVK